MRIQKKILALLVVGIFTTSLFAKKKEQPKKEKALAEWTIVTYIQADNNLAQFAKYNLASMEEAGSTDSVNVLVQWDQPQNRKTWRYRILNGSRVESNSLSAEMGLDPEKELVDCMRWAKKRYPAKHYMLVLWNHGAGIMDLKGNKMPGVPPVQHPWIEIPGFSSKVNSERGILYDDSDNTFLSNQGLSNALRKIKVVLGQKLDVLGMDACLMAMVEVAYQVKGYAKYLVASENVEAAMGWNYSGFLSPLVSQPTLFSPAALAQTIVLAYADYYKDRDSEYTQSAIKVGKIGGVSKSFNRVIKWINKCKKMKKNKTRSIFEYARDRATEFYYTDYIDLHSFYKHMLVKTRALMDDKISAKENRYEKIKAIRYKSKLAKLERALIKAKSKLEAAVIANSSGHAYPDARGLALYYPKYRIHHSYGRTKFAQNLGRWYNFLQKNI